MNHRALLACLLALVLGVVLGGQGCATGGSGDTSGGDAGDDVTIEGGEAGACATGKVLCAGTCVDVGNDPKNCGKCGKACGTSQVCSAGSCSYSCSPPQTLCGLPTPPDGGGGDDGGSGGPGGGDAGASGDSGASAGDAGGSGGADAGDGGAVQPYCASLENDPSNCGTCGTICPPEHVCNLGVCGLSCPPGQDPCIASDSCIPSGTCCSDSQCPITGEICPMPGGQCQCPSGERDCSVTNSCISQNDCCSDSDCTVQGSKCRTPGQACVCANGQKACLATGMCIPDPDCCIPADCGTPGSNNVQSYSCTGGMCGLTCNPGCYNDDGNLANGCECCDDPVGKSCGAATGRAVAIGGSASVTGLLPGPGESDWVQVTFNNDTGNKGYHPHITLSTNPNDEFAFEIDSSCGGPALGCGEGGSCTGKTDWEVFYGAQATGNPGDPSWQPIPSVGTVYVRIYRVSGNASCDPYTLSISE